MKNASTFVASIATILALARIAAFAADSSGEDWPQLLGPHANGISSETGLFDKWPKSGPPLRGRPEKAAGYVGRLVRATSPACTALLAGGLLRAITTIAGSE